MPQYLFIAARVLVHIINVYDVAATHTASLAAWWPLFFTYAVAVMQLVFLSDQIKQGLRQVREVVHIGIAKNTGLTHHMLKSHERTSPAAHVRLSKCRKFAVGLRAAVG